MFFLPCCNFPCNWRTTSFLRERALSSIVYVVYYVAGLRETVDAVSHFIRPYCMTESYPILSYPSSKAAITDSAPSKERKKEKSGALLCPRHGSSIVSYQKVKETMPNQTSLYWKARQDKVSSPTSQVASPSLNPPSLPSVTDQ